MNFKLLLVAAAYQWLLTSSVLASSSSSFDTTLHNDNSLISPTFEVPNLPLLKSTLYNHLTSTTTSRQLTTFDAFNSLLSQIKLQLPSTTLSTNGLDLSISQLVCTNISLQSIQIDHTPLTTTNHRVHIALSGVQLKCNFRWGYKWTIFSGNGNGEAILDQSSGAAINMHFISEDYNNEPPMDANVGACQSNIQIADMTFTGDGLGVVATIIDWIEHLLRDRIEGELNTVVCTELGGLADEALDQLLLDLSEEIEVYLMNDGGGNGQLQQLALENALLEEDGGVPTNEDGDSLYLNFQNMSVYAGEWINSAIDQIDTLLGAKDDLGGLAINAVIRENMLDEEGMLNLDQIGRAHV